MRTGWDREGEEPTAFDAKALDLNSMIGQAPPVALHVTMDSDGNLALSLSRDLSIRVVPPTQPSGEAWRLFETAGPHVVFPVG